MSSWCAGLGLHLAYGASGATGGPSHMPGPTGGRASPSPGWARRGAILRPELAPGDHRESCPAPRPQHLHHLKNESSISDLRSSLCARRPSRWRFGQSARRTEAQNLGRGRLRLFDTRLGVGKAGQCLLGGAPSWGISLHGQPRAAFQRLSLRVPSRAVSVWISAESASETALSTLRVGQNLDRQSVRPT